MISIVVADKLAVEKRDLVKIARAIRGVETFAREKIMVTRPVVAIPSVFIEGSGLMLPGVTSDWEAAGSALVRALKKLDSPILRRAPVRLTGVESHQFFESLVG